MIVEKIFKYLNRVSDEHGDGHFELGDLILAYLHAMDIKFVFGIPGGAIEPFYNAMARSHRCQGPQHILARHESGAVFMASGYARAEKKIGVCCATTGPGTTNLITGISSAYTNYTPLIIITAQTALSHFGWGGFQESSCTSINTVEMLRHCTRYSTLISHRNQIVQKLVTALVMALKPIPGPVHLSIPISLLRERYTAEEFSATYGYQQTPCMAMHDYDTHALLKQIRHAQSGVIFLGLHAKHAIFEIIEFAEKVQWPIITTPMAKGLISQSHPLYCGVFGCAGNPSAEKILLNNPSNLILAVGCEFDEWSTQGWKAELLFNDHIVHICNNIELLARSSSFSASIEADPKPLFKKLLGQLTSKLKKRNFRTTYISYKKTVKVGATVRPEILFDLINSFTPPDALIFFDSGNSFFWGIHYWKTIETSSQESVLTDAISTMGWAIGAAIGSALENPERPIICFTGDGSYLMHGYELQTAVQKKLNILFVVLNDSSLGAIKHGQKLAGSEAIGFELPNTDFSKLTNLLEIPAIRIQNHKDLYEINFEDVFKRTGPLLLDVVIDSEAIPPIASRVKTLTQTEEFEYSPNHLAQDIDDIAI